MTELILPGGDLIYCSTTSTPSPPDIHLVTATFCQHKTKGCLKLVVLLLLYWLCPVYVVPMRIFCETYYKLPKLFISLRKKSLVPITSPTCTREWTHINQSRFRQSRGRIRRDTLKQLVTVAQCNTTQDGNIAQSNATSRISGSSSWK